MRGIAPLAGGLAASLATAGAHGAIFFTFDDPTTGQEVTFDSASGVLSYDTNAPLTLTVDATEEGAGSVYVFENVFLSLSANIGSPNPLGSGAGFEASADGTFTFFQQAARGRGIVEDVPLLSAEFDQGGLVTIGTAGALIGVEPGASAYSAMNDLLDMLTTDGIGPLTGPSDASFTLTNISPAPPVQGGRFVEFTANAAFTGTANIPAPGAGGLAALGGLAFARRRRRH